MITLKLLLKNAFRHRLRTCLTILAMTVAVLAFGLLRTVVDAWYAGVEASSANRLVTRNAISLSFSMPISYAEKIRQVSGVEGVSWGNWFAGIYIDEKNFFANFSVEPKNYLDMAPEFVLAEGEKGEFLKDRKGAIAGRKLAERFGWKTGDPITLKGTIFPGDWDFTLRGIYRGREKNTDESQFFFHWDYMNEVLKKREPMRADQVGFYLIKIKDKDEAARISLEVDRLFKNSLSETLTETERAFQMSFVSMTEAMMTAIQLVSFVIIFIIMAVVANTMAMSVRERMGEYAVFKTLGFGAVYIGALIFGESIVITSAGCVLGIAATFPAAKAFSDQMGQYFPIFFIRPGTIYLDIAATAAVAVISAAAPASRAMKATITEALRRAG